MLKKAQKSLLPSGFTGCGMSWDENVFLPVFPVCNKATMEIANAVGEGVSELRMFFGSGYRIYFGEHANDIVVLLCGGNKKSQSKDIQQATGAGLLEGVFKP